MEEGGHGAPRTLSVLLIVERHASKHAPPRPSRTSRTSRAQVRSDTAARAPPSAAVKLERILRLYCARYRRGLFRYHEGAQYRYRRGAHSDFNPRPPTLPNVDAVSLPQSSVMDTLSCPSYS
eukprot:scaffold310018_cov43-Tisochrysis_lutea.AAC.1